MLVELLHIPTVNPLESGIPPELARAQKLYSDYAATLGFDLIYNEPPPAEALERPDVPAVVRRTANLMGNDFLESQPNIVLRLGAQRSTKSTICFNAHLDTVGNGPPVNILNDRIEGPGALDMKGPAVAVLAGVRLALQRQPHLAETSTVLIQAVGGEESGAMGTYGTRVVMEAGFVGSLNVFAEPTDGWYIDRSPATMTAHVRVAGRGTTDDEPEAGENASLLLGYVACHLASELDEPVNRVGGKLCIAGLHTGEMHNRVYGQGSLLVNVAYSSRSAERDLSRRVESAVHHAIRSFRNRFHDIAVARRTAERAADICYIEWLKKGFPALDNRDEEWERRLENVGIPRLPEQGALRPFTCDAIWGAFPQSYTIIFGPGNLERNGAHTPREHILLTDLASYSSAVSRIILALDEVVEKSQGET